MEDIQKNIISYFLFSKNEDGILYCVYSVAMQIAIIGVRGQGIFDLQTW